MFQRALEFNADAPFITTHTRELRELCVFAFCLRVCVSENLWEEVPSSQTTAPSLLQTRQSLKDIQNELIAGRLSLASPGISPPTLLQALSAVSPERHSVRQLTASYPLISGPWERLNPLEKVDLRDEYSRASVALRERTCRLLLLQAILSGQVFISFIKPRQSQLAQNNHN
jgi:hypothetical protein